MALSVIIVKKGTYTESYISGIRRDIFPDMHFTIDDMIAEGDKVAIRFTWRGTDTVGSEDRSPTGIQVTQTAIGIIRFAGDKIAEQWLNKDQHGLWQQLGVVPPMGREDYSWGESSKVTGSPGDPEENKAIFRRLFEEVWNKGDLDVHDEIGHPDAVYHEPAAPNVRSKEDYRQYVSDTRAAFPDLHMTVEDMLAEADKVLTRWTFRGTHKGELSGISPTGKQVVFTGTGIARVADGRIVEGWVCADTRRMLQQMGAIPTPGE